MTDPIAVDVPKPSFARSVPGSVPPAALPPLPAPFVPKPEPKPEPKADAVKAAPPPAAPPATSTITPAPAAPDGTTKVLGLFTKKQLTIGASAVFSLAAGIGALRLMFPAKDQPKPAVTSAQDWAATPRAEPKEPPKPAAPPTISADNLPPIPLPTEPPFPSTPVARPTGISPLPPTAPSVFPPPTVEPKLPPLPPPSGFEPTLPTVPVTPIGGTEPKLPPLPTLPTLPAVPAPGAPMVPAVPPPSGLDPLIPPPPKIEPKVEPKALPKVEPVFPTIPAPGGGPGVTVVPPPVFPAEPKFEPKVEPKVPNPFPPVVDITPKVEPKLPDPFPPVGTPTNFTKPGGTTDPKPFVPETLPKTNFDVDLYEPRATDSYDSISQEFYNDKRFAGALRAFNRNQALTAVRYVEVPPMHVLRRQFGGQVGAGTAPTGSGAPLWGAATDPTPPPAARGRTTFVVPPGGMTMRAVARETLGSDLRWNDIYDLNPQFKPSELIPAGTELKVPPGARVQ